MANLTMTKTELHEWIMLYITEQIDNQLSEDSVDEGLLWSEFLTMVKSRSMLPWLNTANLKFTPKIKSLGRSLSNTITESASDDTVRIMI